MNPPGIITLAKDKSRSPRPCGCIDNDIDYTHWYDQYTKLGYKPHVIKVNNILFSIDEKFKEGRITAFRWAQFMWLCELDGHTEQRYDPLTFGKSGNWSETPDIKVDMDDIEAEALKRFPNATGYEGINTTLREIFKSAIKWYKEKEPQNH